MATELMSGRAAVRSAPHPTHSDTWIIVSYSSPVSPQVRPHPEVGALPAGGPGHVPGHAEAALHERTGTDREAVRGVQAGPPHRAGASQAEAAVVCPAARQEFLS